MKFRPHLPGSMDIDREPDALFETVAELLAIPQVVRFAALPDFHRFSLGDDRLMAEFREGYEWWVVGYVDGDVSGWFEKWEPRRKRVMTTKEPILQFFESAHLPPHLKEVSANFATVATWIVETLPRNAERTVALRKLLEAKDAAVRARLFKDETG